MADPGGLPLLPAAGSGPVCDTVSRPVVPGPVLLEAICRAPSGLRGRLAESEEKAAVRGFVTGRPEPSPAGRPVTAFRIRMPSASRCRPHPGVLTAEDTAGRGVPGAERHGHPPVGVR